MKIRLCEYNNILILIFFIFKVNRARDGTVNPVTMGGFENRTASMQYWAIRLGSGYVTGCKGLAVQTLLSLLEYWNLWSLSDLEQDAI